MTCNYLDNFSWQKLKYKEKIDIYIKNHFLNSRRVKFIIEKEEFDNVSVWDTYLESTETYHC